jgi:hypothetical protein
MYIHKVHNDVLCFIVISGNAGIMGLNAVKSLTYLHSNDYVK